MATDTAIEWTHCPGYKGKSWNPVTGCTKIAQGCKHCYAETLAKRFWKDRAFTDVQTHADRLDEPLRRRLKTCYFVNSMSDLFHEAVPFEFIAAVYGVMAACPQHLFIILTKRPKRMREFFEWLADKAKEGTLRTDWLHGEGVLLSDYGRVLLPNFPDRLQTSSRPWPLPNVIHGYSAANQADLDAGIADLLATPSTLRCLSLEPLIGPVDLRQHLHDFGCPCGWGGDSPDAKCHECGWIGSDLVVEGLCPHCSQPLDDTDVCPECKLDSRDGAGFGPNEDGRPDWVIVGGESGPGPGVRPCDIAWIRSIVSQCKAADVPCFVKQFGANPYQAPRHDGDTGFELGLRDRKGADPAEWPEDLRVREFPEVGNG
ncbi:MAG: DUF5131 family protein [Planctomycetes bacterium]|nr:DUF5131 family protein [Planctomycetota bacterium]